jgi:hypothetical protein
LLFSRAGRFASLNRDVESSLSIVYVAAAAGLIGEQPFGSDKSDLCSFNLSFSLLDVAVRRDL